MRRATAVLKRQETPEGYEYHFGLNFLSRFLMVSELLEQLVASGTSADPARVLLVGSARHWGTPVLGFAGLGAPLPLALGLLEDLQLKLPGAYDAWKAFGQAALCNVLFAYELQRRLRLRGVRTVAATCFDPGPMTTAWELYSREENRMLAVGLPGWARGPLAYFTRLVEAPEEAAAAPVCLATTLDGTLPCREPRVGNLGYWERGSPAPSKYPLPWSWGTSYDEGVWAQLWELSVVLTGASGAAAVPGH